MKGVLSLLVLLGAAVLPLNAQDDCGGCEGPSRRCSQNMCPAACASTQVGFEAISRLQLVHVDEEEFLV